MNPKSSNCDVRSISIKKLHQLAKIASTLTFQVITFNEWLPLILGEEGVAELETYKRYDRKVDPSIRNEFATAAFRFGHGLIRPITFRLDEQLNDIPEGPIQLHQAFFSPWRIVQEGT